MPRFSIPVSRKTKTGYFWALARDDRPWGGSGPPGVACPHPVSLLPMLPAVAGSMPSGYCKGSRARSGRVA